jgi:pterin-4a-carbinolamine dehydratase
VPTLLDASLIADSLTSLPGWQGSADRLTREVHLSSEQATELRRQVAVDAGAMNHAALVEPIEGGLRFVLRTEDPSGVTELDVMLASHISDLVHRISADEPGVHAQRTDDPVVVFRAGEGATGDDTPEAEDSSWVHAASARGGSTPAPLPATGFVPNNLAPTNTEDTDLAP